jgi:hypothetical protein
LALSNKQFSSKEMTQLFYAIPGPIAVYQFALLGYAWKSLLLIFHPINAYVHTALLIAGSKYGGAFSDKV